MKERVIVGFLMGLLYIPALLALITGSKFFMIFTLIYWGSVLALSLLSKGGNRVNEAIFFIWLLTIFAVYHVPGVIGIILKGAACAYLMWCIASGVIAFVKLFKKDGKETLDITSMHPSSIVAIDAFGDRYTDRFREEVDARRQNVFPIV